MVLLGMNIGVFLVCAVSVNIVICFHIAFLFMMISILFFTFASYNNGRNRSIILIFEVPYLQRNLSCVAFPTCLAVLGGNRINSGVAFVMSDGGIVFMIPRFVRC